jgi:hypothetical protein
MPTNFEDLVRQYADKKKSAAESVDWEERKEWWKGRVSLLFDEILNWLKNLVESGTIEFTRGNVSLTEEALGPYEVESCTIILQQEKLTFKPVGSVIIGGFGRIDVDGPNGHVMLILCTPDNNVPPNERRNKAEWFISHPKQRTNLRPFTKEAFEQLFADLFGIGE